VNVMDAGALRKGEVRSVVGVCVTTGVQVVADTLEVEVDGNGLGITAKGFDVELIKGVCGEEIGVATGACVAVACEVGVDVHIGVNVVPVPVTVDCVAALDTVALAELESPTSGSTGRGIAMVRGWMVTRDATKH
jgi:hypothetical protein